MMAGQRQKAIIGENNRTSWIAGIGEDNGHARRFAGDDKGTEALSKGANFSFGALLRIGFLGHRQRSSLSRPATTTLLMRPQPLTDSSPAMEVDLTLAQPALLTTADDIDEAIRNMFWRRDDLADEFLQILA